MNKTQNDPCPLCGAAAAEQEGKRDIVAFNLGMAIASGVGAVFAAMNHEWHAMCYLTGGAIVSSVWCVWRRRVEGRNPAAGNP